MKGGYSFSSKETAAVSVAVGFGVAAVAGLAAGAALGAGGAALLSAAGRRHIKDPLGADQVKRDAEGRITNWSSVVKLAQQAVRIILL